MAVLNTILSSFPMLISATKVERPFGLWEWLILKVFGGIQNYGLRIIIFIITLKLVLLPLDIFQRYKMRKNAKITEDLKPDIDKLKRQYADDPRMLSSKQMELNRKAGYSYFSSCIPMLLTLVIFISLFSGMRNISQYMVFRQYSGWYDTYNAAIIEYEEMTDNYKESKQVFETNIASYVDTIDSFEQQKQDLQDSILEYTLKIGELNSGGLLDEIASQGKTKEQLIEEYTNLINDLLAQIQELDGKISDNMVLLYAQEAGLKNLLTKAIDYAQDKVVQYNDDNADSFLWIKSLWQPDVFWKKPIHSSKSAFQSSVGDYAKISKDKGEVGEAVLEDMLASYDNVTRKLVESPDNKENGYLVLVILSFLLSVCSQFIMQKLQKKSGQFDSGAGMNNGVMKFMMFLMPAIMAYFAIQYTAAFALYMVANSAITILINVTTTFIMNSYDKRQKIRAEGMVFKHGRPDPNAIQKNNNSQSKKLSDKNNYKK